MMNQERQSPHVVFIIFEKSSIKSVPPPEMLLVRMRDSEPVKFGMRKGISRPHSNLLETVTRGWKNEMSSDLLAEINMRKGSEARMIQAGSRQGSSQDISVKTGARIGYQHGCGTPGEMP